MAFIDSMRLLAASLVLLQHLFEVRSGFAKTWLIPLAPGVAGVAIFFFISGYVIPMATRNGLDVREFMVRRLFRIYPLYLVTLALIALAGATHFLPQLDFVSEAPLRVWIPNVLLIAEYVQVRPFLGVSWTLAVELVWYALFAASFIVFGKRAADRLDVFVPVTLVAMAVISLLVGVRIPLGRPTMIYAAVIGFQCYRFHMNAIDARGLVRSISVFVLVTLASTYVSFGIFKHPNLTLAQAMGPWIVSTTIFLGWVLYRPIREARILNGGLLPALGAMSYSIYLLHPLATAAADGYLPEALQVPTAVVLTFALSWLGFYLIEKPGIRAGRRVARQWMHPAGKARLI
jgi:peptidoglycan/LPS O-acetylase OafA/YrhL